MLILNGINGLGNKLLSLLLGLAALTIFLFVEKIAANPVMSLSLFKSRIRANAYLIRFIYSAAITSFWFLTPRILQTVYHLTPIWVGLSFLPMTIVNFLAAKQVNALIKKQPQEKIMMIGLAIVTIGFAGLLLLQRNSNYWLAVALPMILVGYGQGLILSPVTNLAVTGLPSSLGGIGSGLINVMLQIGGAMGLAILSVISGPKVTICNYHLQMLGIVLLSLVSLALSLIYLRKNKER